MTTVRSGRRRTFLSLHQAAFRLGDRLVFEDTDWVFGRDEQWAVIGPNGSGKSVLGDALWGRLPLIQGELCYHFRPPEGLSCEDAIGHVAFEDRKSELHGTVVQSRWTSFEQEGSERVRDFLSYDRVMEINPFEVTTRHARARPAFERRLRRAAALLQIGQYMPRTLLSLSNGERQRVQLARALACPLRLLILDEPYVGLDAAARTDFHKLLEPLLRTRLRVLLLTTRVEDLPGQITHLLRVDDCRVVDSGPRAAVLKRLDVPSHRPTPAVHRNTRPAGRPPGGRGTVGSLVRLRNVTVQYGSRVILRQVDWTVRPGESWALLGPNGSGKTTLLSLILGDNPQAYVNDVSVFGRRRGDGEPVWRLKQRIGWVSPELQLHFDDAVSVSEVVLSGFQETVGIFAKPAARQQAVAQRCLVQFGLHPFAEQPLFSLSAGLQRMALLARALVKRPRLLILDEPCQGLDPAHRDLIVERVDALIQTRGVTAIFVTHRPEEIPASVRRVLRLTGDGRAHATDR